MNDKDHIGLRQIARGAPLLAILLASACTMTGTGVGQSRVPGAAATFSWTAKDARTGTMTAVLADGRTYTGDFFQITRETRVEDLGPLWMGWGPGPGWRGRGWGWGGWGGGGWGGWGYWGPSDQFITHYSGKVLANLTGPDGQMRCRFTLIRPSSGMVGGGQGQCQLADGTRIQASFAGR